jgi:hypothetical protein
MNIAAYKSRLQVGMLTMTAGPIVNGNRGLENMQVPVCGIVETLVIGILGQMRTADKQNACMIYPESTFRESIS